MHQEEINIVGPQIFERVIEGRLDVLWRVGVVPELGGDEEALSVHSGSFDSSSDCWLCSVDVCSVNVAILL